MGEDGKKKGRLIIHVLLFCMPVDGCTHPTHNKQHIAESSPTKCNTRATHAFCTGLFVLFLLAGLVIAYIDWTVREGAPWDHELQQPQNNQTKRSPRGGCDKD